MSETISPSEVYDKDLNFLFGSGASAGLFPTLELEIKDEAGKRWTLESLGAHFEDTADERHIPLFMHYYNTCINPAQAFTSASVQGHPEKEQVLKNYRAFFETVLQILPRRRALERRCNLFTTNYDSCFSIVGDQLLREGNVDFVLNDGARGFSNRYLQTRNFNTFLCQTGVFERHQVSVPQINLLHVHGSVSWKKDSANIVVDHKAQPVPHFLNAEAQGKLQAFSACLANPDATLADLTNPDFTPAERHAFWSEYKKLPIVNPTKWKFHETVFEEHYYQMLRMLSYELEKPNAVLVTFGFSFADEHILNIVKRSLSNPRLQVFVCCYSVGSRDRLRAEFRGHKNVQCIALEGAPLDFTAFNERVFLLEDPQPTAKTEGNDEAGAVSGEAAA